MLVAARSTEASRVSRHSLKYTAASSAGGAASPTARTTSLAEPTTALAIPPPVSPTGTGSRVRNAQFSAAIPCTSKYPRIPIRSVTAVKAQRPVRASMAPENSRLPCTANLEELIAQPAAAAGAALPEEMGDQGHHQEHQP